MARRLVWMPVLPRVTVSNALNLRGRGFSASAWARRGKAAERSQAAPAAQAERRRNSRRFMEPPEKRPSSTPTMDGWRQAAVIKHWAVLWNSRSLYLKGERGALISLLCGRRASKDKFERMRDSTWSQTAGSHSIWMWGFMIRRSHQGYSPQLNGL